MSDLEIEIREHPFGRFGFLLVALLFFLVSSALLADSALAPVRFRVFFTVILIAGIYAVSNDRRALLAAIALAAPPVVFAWLGLFADVPSAWLVSHLTGAAFVAFASGFVLLAVLREEEVSTDTLLGGVCVYILIGLAFAFTYGALLEWDPTALSFPPHAGEWTSEVRVAETLYFSFVTLTTLGYGDIVPVSETARMLAAGEAVSGQVYLTVLVARLVGLHISMGHRRAP
ncbi:MAG: potassium channel family protein [Myxococcota bacterium]